MPSGIVAVVLALVCTTIATAASVHESDAGTCGKCHTQSSAVATSPMVRTLMPGVELDGKRGGSVSLDGFEYRIRDGFYEVRRGSESIRVPILWAFGSGRTGQTFVFKLDDKLHESRVSWYKRIDGLQLTVGAVNAKPANLREAAGRQMSPADIKECFGCHSTPAGKAPTGAPEALLTGVGCARCHRMGPSHPGATAATAKATAVSLRQLDAQEVSELCGECHRTWEQVMLLKLRGVSTIRFQPYRLTQSKCYDPADRRIACTQCHDPHRPAEMSVVRVDHACRSCHTGEAGKHLCSDGGKRQCASCHMPKMELPGAHAEFSDHRIRVVRAGEPFPD